MKRRTFVAMAIAASVLLAGGCGANGEDSSLTTGDGELASIKVGSTGLTVHAPLYIAQEMGWFEEEGLDVELQVFSGGAAIIPALINGELHFGDSNLPSALLAVSNGIALRAVATNNVSAPSLDDESILTSAIVAPNDGPINEPADLADKTIAVNSLNNLGDLTTRIALNKRGIDPEGIQFIEMPLPDMIGALQAERVDAAWVVEPFLSAGMAAGMEPILYNWEESAPHLPIGTYFTSEEFLNANEDIAAAFARAVERATNYAMDSPQSIRDVILDYTQVPPAVADSMALPVLTTELDRDGIGILVDEMISTGALEEPIDVDAVFSRVIG